MKNKVLRETNQFYLKRYLLVLVLFVVAYIFGKNMNVLTPEQQQLQNQANAWQKKISGVYSIPAGQNEYKLENIILVKRSQCGRLFFDLKSLTLDGLTPENSNIKVHLSNDFDQSQELGSYEIENDWLVRNEEIYFCASYDYQDLIFRKDENNQNTSYEISNVAFYPITIDKHDFSGLLAPIIGNTDFSKVIYQSGLENKDANGVIKFTRRNQKIGQTFMANSDVISGVDMKLEFVGTGGIGNYFLELREAIDRNGKLELSSDRIAYYMFNKDSAERDLKIEEGIYHIPLTAQLERGRTYYIGINNEAVKFNILNTLKIYSGIGNSEAGKLINSVGGKTSEKSGSLYLKAYGAYYLKIGDEKVLTGVRILDNGDETGQYVYKQKGNFSDYLDLDQLISKDNSSVFYDNVQAGVSAEAEDDNAFIYKIDTIHPFLKVKIEAEQPGGEFTNSLVYYSYDNMQWQEIKNDLDKDELAEKGNKNKFQELVQGDGKQKTIYIKVTYDKDDAQEKTVHLFDLKNLTVIAELKLK